MVNGERIGGRLCVISTGSLLKVKGLTGNGNTPAAASSAGNDAGGFKTKPTRVLLNITTKDM